MLDDPHVSCNLPMILKSRGNFTDHELVKNISQILGNQDIRYVCNPRVNKASILKTGIVLLVAYLLLK